MSGEKPHRANDKPQQLFVLQRQAPRTDTVNRQPQRVRGSMIYRAGAVPSWVGDSSHDDMGLLSGAVSTGGPRKRRPIAAPKLVARGEAAAAPRGRQARRAREPTVVSTGAGSDSVRVGQGLLAEADVARAGDDGATAGRVKLEFDPGALEVPEGPDDSSDGEESSGPGSQRARGGSNDDVDARRARIRARKLAQMCKEEEATGSGAPRAAATARQRQPRENSTDEDGSKSDSGSGSESGSESDSESDSDSDEAASVPMLRPVFVSRRERKTVEARERMEAAEAEFEREKRRRDKERKEQAQELVIQQLKLEEAEEAKANADEDMPDDTDGGPDKEDEFKQWKLRELRRLLRDKERREAEESEAAIVAERRQMSDAQIEADNRKRGVKAEKEKGEMRFMQKYYHKGAFFMDQKKDIFKRDFTKATGVARERDISALPKVLQVKKFGFAGRTKYTHLADQDTTFQGRSKAELDERRRLKARVPGLRKRGLTGSGSVDQAFRRIKKHKGGAGGRGASTAGQK